MIEVRGLTKHYGNRQALCDVSFSVKQGEIVGLLGLNGAGKSTTMNILTGYISPTAGTASVNGHDIVEEPAQAKRQIGYLPEQLAFYTDMRVGEYLEFICDLKKVREGRAEALSAICRQVGIDGMLRRLIRNLSKGYRQRVGLAQALVGAPKVLILDEPTVGLDPSQIIEIREVIRQVARSCTVIISSHILPEIQAVCSRVLVLYNGRLVADSPTGELAGMAQAPGKLTVRVMGAPQAVTSALKGLGSTVKVTKLETREQGACDFELVSGVGKDIREELFRRLAKADLPLLYSTGGDMGLEEVFLSLVREQGRQDAQEVQTPQSARRTKAGPAASPNDAAWNAEVR